MPLNLRVIQCNTIQICMQTISLLHTSIEPKSSGMRTPVLTAEPALSGQSGFFFCLNTAEICWFLLDQKYNCHKGIMVLSDKQGDIETMRFVFGLEDSIVLVVL